MDKLISQISALGVPGLVLLVAIELTGLSGAAAIAAALSALGPGGMLGGIMTLVVISGIATGLTNWGFDAIAEGVIKDLYCKGETKESIKKKIEKYPISSSLKAKLREIVDKFAE